MPELWGYQREDFDRVISLPNLLLAYEMRTGKTPLGISVDLYRREHDDGLDKKTLVICPMPAFSVWEDHYGLWAPHLKVRTVDPKNREAFLSVEADVYIVHWQVLRLMPELQEIHWLHVIGDECHRANNRTSAVTRALKAIQAPYKTGLTGTGGITNKPDGMWSILHWLYPKQWSSYWRFRKLFVREEIDQWGYRHIVGVKNELKLHLEIAPYYARRLREDVLKVDKPVYGRIVVNLHPKQRRAYDEMKRNMITWIGEAPNELPLTAAIDVAKYVRMQQFSAGYARFDDNGKVTLAEPSAKLDALIESIQDLEGRQAVVFSVFVQTLRLLQARLDKLGISWVAITGDDSNPKRRRASLDSFQRGEARVFLGTISAASEAIDLSTADTMYFLDREWNPGPNDQAEARCLGPAQQYTVQIIDIIGRDTLDLERKQRVATKKEWRRRMLGDK